MLTTWEPFPAAMQKANDKIDKFTPLIVASGMGVAAAFFLLFAPGRMQACLAIVVCECAPALALALCICMRLRVYSSPSCLREIRSQQRNQLKCDNQFSDMLHMAVVPRARTNGAASALQASRLLPALRPVCLLVLLCWHPLCAPCAHVHSFRATRCSKPVYACRQDRSVALWCTWPKVNPAPMSVRVALPPGQAYKAMDTILMQSASQMV